MSDEILGFGIVTNVTKKGNITKKLLPSWREKLRGAHAC